MTKDFTWSQAALEGFRVLRREPRAWLFSGALVFLIGLVNQVLVTRTALSRAADPASGVAMVLTVLQFAVTLAALSAFANATYRAILFPAESSGRMRFGRAEIRGALVWLVQGLVLLAPFLILVPVTLAVSLLGRSTGLIVALIPSLTLIGCVIVCLWVLGRLAVAGPMALVERRWSVGAAWRLTRGHTWKIIGVYLTVMAMVSVAYVAWWGLYGLIAKGLGAPFSAQMPKDAPITEVFRPWRLGFELGLAWVAAAGYAVANAPAAVIYRTLRGEASDDQAAVFD